MFFNVGMVLADFIAVFVMLIISVLIMYQGDLSGFGLGFYMTGLGIAFTKCLLGIICGSYRLLWMYSIRRNMLQLLLVVFGYDLILLALTSSETITNYTGLTFTGYLVLMFIEFVYFVSSRFLLSVYFNYYYDRKPTPEELKRTVIIGAGSAGAMVLNEIGAYKEFGYKVVGLVDDSEDKIGNVMNNVKIYGPINNINQIVSKLRASKIIVAIPTAGRERIQEVLNLIDYKDVSVEILPDKSKLLTEDLAPTIRKVEIADLLGRSQVELDKSKLNEFINDKIVLVTGGGGSIGSEICRQVLDYKPKKLIIFDIYENTTYELKMELDMKYHNSEYKPEYLCLIGSVRDQNRLEEVFSTYKPNLVFHAAAHKHVPLMEDSPYEAIKNNVKGTYNVAMMADKYDVDKMVLISTDKAVNPTNVMGATKRFCEMVLEAWNDKSEHTAYSMVRFGNVLGSNGSVIPLFRRQIEAGGPVTVTSDKINRFFMTIPEACGLVIQSGAYAAGGEKFILDMGEPVKIIDLAKNMIKLSGLELGKDINIEITGLRPGEKLYEELLLKTANATKTQNDKIYVEMKACPFNLQQIDEIIAKLESLGHDNKAILDYLKEIEIIKVKNAKKG